MDKEKKSFVGPNEVLGVSVIEDKKTFGGKDMVKVMYVNDKIPAEIMPMKSFEIMVTAEPKDWNYLRDVQFKVLTEELSAVCMEYHIIYGDIDALASDLKNKLKSSFEKADNFLWTGDDKQWIPGIPPVTYRSLFEANEVLKKIKPDEETSK